MAEERQERLVVPEKMRTRTVKVGINFKSLIITVPAPWAKLLNISKGDLVDEVFMHDLDGFLVRKHRPD